MARPIEFVTLDVFTRHPFAGNPLAVVLGADGLTDRQMQVIAREFNLSETIFVQRPADPSHSAKVRIFFPTAEIPFAGHPTIGCAIHLALLAAPQGDFETVITLEEVAGLVPVAVTRRGGDLRAELTAPVIPHAADRGQVPKADLLAQALGVQPDQIGFATPGHQHKPGLWQGGPRFLYVPVADRQVLAQARPCEPAWSRIMETAAVDSAYLYCAGSGADYQARMFSPGAGIPEDPATGSASAILAAQLLATGLLPEGETRLTLLQGAEMHRPSEIGLRITVQAGQLHRVQVAGSAVQISRGELFPPMPGYGA